MNISSEKSIGGAAEPFSLIYGPLLFKIVMKRLWGAKDSRDGSIAAISGKSKVVCQSDYLTIKNRISVLLFCLFGSRTRVYLSSLYIIQFEWLKLSEMVSFELIIFWKRVFSLQFVAFRNHSVFHDNQCAVWNVRESYNLYGAQTGVIDMNVRLLHIYHKMPNSRG